jgi:hypothetical protein
MLTVGNYSSVKALTEPLQGNVRVSCADKAAHQHFIVAGFIEDRLNVEGLD